VEPKVYQALKQWRLAVQSGKPPEDAVDRFRRGLKVLRDIAMQEKQKNHDE
jgi:hypothetical protein